MKSLVRPLLAGVVGLAAIVASGDQPPPAAPSPPGPPATAPAVAPTPPPAPAGDIEDFVPSEQVSADDAVAFPVDI